MLASSKPLAVYENAPLKLGDKFASKSRLHPAEAEEDTVYKRRPAGEEKDTAVHELRHAAIDWLLKNTDLKDNELFDRSNFPIVPTEEYLMDVLSMEAGEKGKEAKLPEFTGTRFTKKIDPEQTQRRAGTDTEAEGRPDASFPEQRQLLNTYATDALKDFNVPDYTERQEPQEPIQEEEPEKLNFFQRIFGKKEGGLMMAQEGQALLPMTQATSAPQGGGPKAANPAARTALVAPPQQAPRPGAIDPRDEAVKIVAQDMQKAQAPIPTAMPMPVAPPQAMAGAQMGGLAAPMNETVPMMAKGGTKEDSPDGLAVMIGLGAPAPANFEKAAEGNPPPGATKSEVADDQLVLLSEGELVVPANVVRYHGLGTYEGMRREALMGLQGMEESGQIEYVSGGKKKADPIDDDGGLIKAQAGTTVLGGARTTNLANPIASGVQTLAAPQAASSQFVSGPGIPRIPGANPQITPTIGQKKPDMRLLYAPNVGAYSTYQTPETEQPEQPETDQPPTSGGGQPSGSQDSDDGPSPEQRASEQRYKELVNNRKSAAKELGYTREQSLGSGLAGLNPITSFLSGAPEAGTILLDGTIADGRGNSFDPITGDQVGFKGGIVGNIAGRLGLMEKETPEDIAKNIPEASYAGLMSQAGERSIRDAIEQATSQTPVATSQIQETSTPMDAAETVGIENIKGTLMPSQSDANVPAPEVQSAMDNILSDIQNQMGEYTTQMDDKSVTNYLDNIIQQTTRPSYPQDGKGNTILDSLRTPVPLEYKLKETEEAAVNDIIAAQRLKERLQQSTEREKSRTQKVDAGTTSQTESAFSTPEAQRRADMETERFERVSGQTQEESDRREATIQGHQSRYESQGYSPSEARSAAVNKTDADNEAKQQTGSPFATAVTSSDGTPVRSETSGKVVTNDYEAAEERSDDGGGCCFIMLEARYGDGTMDEVVRRYRDEHMTVKNKRGYYKLAEVFVPLMRKYPAFKWLVTKTFADPLVSYGKYYYGQNKHGVIFAPVKAFWMKVFDVLGTDTEFVRENGEVI